MKLYAQKYGQTYKIKPTVLSKEQHICNHEIVFSNDAGINDVMKVEFKKLNQNTIVYFAVGENYENSVGQTMKNTVGEILQIGFPNSLYLTIQHDIAISDQLEFEFWYLDLDATEADKKYSVSGYNL